MPSNIHLTTALPDQWAAAQKGKYLDTSHYSELLGRQPTNVYKPDGSPLLLYRPNAVPLDVCNLALPALRKAATRPNDHRDYLVSEAIGYYNCRMTAFTARNLDGWGSCLPFIRACNRVFRRELPSRYLPQRRLALQKTADELVIADTAFTTVTVNRWDATHDAQTRVHKDKGDLNEGFGVISVLSTGTYDGGFLVFPQYRVAVDIRTTDVLLCDVHEWHGNSAIVGQPGWQRISCILYYRTDMQHCDQGTGTTTA